MSYWSGEKLKENISKLDLIKPYDSKSIDCASYKLHVGNEAFVSKDLINGDTKEKIKEDLSSPGSIVNIRPGQFAFLLTLEDVTVPHDAIAFISIRSTYKFKGLINVSGFHVDPGYSGKLIFGLYNAGPMPIILSKSEPLFLIFYASLDQTSKETFIGKARNSIGSDLIQNMAGQVFSPLFLQRKMERLEDANVALDRSQSTLVAKSTTAIWMAGIIIAILATTVGFLYNSTSVQAYIGGWIKDAIEANTAYKKDSSYIPAEKIPQNLKAKK